MSQDIWHEGAEAQLLNFNSSGTFTLHGAHIAAQDPGHGGVQQNIPSVQLNNFSGNFSLLAANFAIRNTLAVQGSSSNLNVLAMGIVGPWDNANFFANTAPSAQTALLNSRQSLSNAGSVPVADQTANVASIPNFIRQMVAQTRQEQAHAFAALSSGITDARFYRVSVDSGLTGFQLNPGGPSSTNAPILSGIAASSVSSTSATISWTTNEPADSQVEFGTTASYGSFSSVDTANVTGHSVILNGLIAGTVYHFRVRSRSLSGYLTILRISVLPPQGAVAFLRLSTVSVKERRGTTIRVGSA